MAFINKTYVSKEEYIQAREWWLSTRELQKKVLGEEIYLYPFSSFRRGENVDNSTRDIELFKDDNCLWNTSTKKDIWIAKNCPLPFIQEWSKRHLGEQLYNLKDEFIFDEEFNNLKILQVEGFNNKIYINFWRDVEINGVEMVETIDEIIVYGTTYIFEVLKQVKLAISEYSFAMQFKTIKFDLFGLDVVLKNGKFYIHEGSENETEFKMFYINNEEFWLPKIKYSFDIKDAKKYKNDEIFMSDEKDVFDITCYQNFDRDMLPRYISFLPDYMTDQIKYNLKRINKK